MKTQLFKFVLPIGFGLALLTITIIGITSTTFTSCEAFTQCAAGQCVGTNGHCYSCDAGSYCTTSPSGNCSSSVAGVACCTGSSGCTPTGCPATSPWLCGGLCYATVPSGNHSCIKCP